jgi:hypothetical protein
MWDHNVDTKGGVSIWDHVLDGAATGAIAGSVLPVAGNLAGAIGGAGIGLVNGLAQDWKLGSSWDSFWNGGAEKDEGTLGDIEGMMERMAMDPADFKKYSGKQNDAAGVEEAARRVHNDRFAAENDSWFNRLF